jgi:hypothetical protein
MGNEAVEAISIDSHYEITLLVIQHNLLKVEGILHHY